MSEVVGARLHKQSPEQAIGYKVEMLPILTWLDLESAGPNEESLDAMIAELQYPLPEPRGA
ncbi:MAG: hypothetical protein GKR94_09405 [Gammaproteobacteria bacterium]|nr:hypothetical protein [Gammaproteobacteria bacterium]